MGEEERHPDIGKEKDKPSTWKERGRGRKPVGGQKTETRRQIGGSARLGEMHPKKGKSNEGRYTSWIKGGRSCLRVMGECKARGAVIKERW